MRIFPDKDDITPAFIRPERGTDPYEIEPYTDDILPDGEP